MNLKIENLNFSYSKEKLILKDINLEINDGEVLSILGPNGVGKTTFLKCIMNMEKITKGLCVIDGVNIKDIPEKNLWQKISYVPQAKSQNFAYTAEEMVILGRSAYVGMFSKPNKKDFDIAYESMEKIGILHLKDKYCNKMSGGELQMVLIARALTSNPKLLILDEPESNLDFKNQLVVLDTIKNLSQNHNIACIFNTHYPTHAMQVSTHSLILNRDLTNVFGNTKDVLNEQNLQESFDVKVKINKIQIEKNMYHSIVPICVVK